MALKVYNSQVATSGMKLALPTLQAAKAGNVAAMLGAANEPETRALAGVAQSYMNYLDKRQQKQDETELAAATTELQKRAMRFQSNYKQTVFGKDAFGAEDAFGGNVRGEVDALVDERFKDKPELAARFRQSSTQLELNSMAAGFAYGDSQMTKYQDETIKGKLDLLQDTIGTGSDAEITAAQDDYLKTLATLRPGMNLETEIRNSDMMVAGGRIDRAIANGNLAAAQSLFKSGYARLGKNAPTYQAKILHLQKSQEAEARARRTEALSKLAVDGTAAMFQAEHQGNTAALREIGERMVKMGDKRGQKFIQHANDLDQNRETMSYAQTVDIPELQSEFAKITKLLTPNKEGKLLNEAGAEIDEATYKQLVGKAKVFEKVLNTRIKALKEDPAAAADTSIEGLGADVPMPIKVTARMEYQRKSGVPNDKIAPLTKGEVDGLVQQYQKTPQKSQFITYIMDTFGSQGQAVMKQLVASGKMSADFNLIHDMPADSGNMLAVTSGKDWTKNTEEGLGMDADGKKALKTAVTGELRQFNATLSSQGDSTTAKNVQDATYRLSLKYMEQGMAPADAAKKAAGAVALDRYKVRGAMRIPAKYDADSVEKGTGTAAGSLDLDTLVPIAGFEQAGLSKEAVDRRYRNLLKTKGKWVMLPDESGVMLTVNGKAVMRKDGKPVTETFDNLESYGQAQSSFGGARKVSLVDVDDAKGE